MCLNKIFIYSIYIEVSGNVSIINNDDKLKASLKYASIKNNLLNIFPTFDIECGDKILFLQSIKDDWLDINNLKSYQIIDKISAF